MTSSDATPHSPAAHADAGAAAGCPHCAAGVPHPHEEVAERVAARRVALGRRATTRGLLAALGVGVVVVLALRDDDVAPQLAVLGGSALAWILAVVLGFLLGAVVARRRPPRVVVAAAATCAAGVAPLLAWVLVSVVDPAPLAPLAAGIGWYAASAVADVVRTTTTRRLLDADTPAGDEARAREATVAADQDSRDDRRALLGAAGFALAVLLVAVVGPLALVLAPLAAAAAAWTSLHERR